mgnify:CR=1 FL=1
MSNLVAFLESLGADSRLAGLSDADYAAALGQLDLSAPVREALRRRDVAALHALVADAPMMLVLVPGDEAPDDDDDGKDEDPPSA